MLALALTDPAQLDGFLAFTDLFIVKCAEFGLVFLLAVHMFGGLRLMALEFLPWSPRQKTSPHLYGDGLFYLNQLFSAGDVTDAPVT